MRKMLVGILGLMLALVLALGVTTVAFAATTANVDVKATPSFISISCNASTYDFGSVNQGVNATSITNQFAITNSSTIQTDQTMGVNATTWAGGVTWTHSDTASAGADTAGLVTNRGGVWGTGDIVVKQAAPNYIYENCPATTNYNFGLKLVTPTSFSDGAEKSIRVTVTAAAG